MEKLKIIGATLLRINEAEILPDYLRKYNRIWWLRSPGHTQDYAASVYYNGSVSYYGDFVCNNRDAVRPALKISNLKSSGLKVGDRFYFGDVEFEVISSDLAFCRTDIGCCAFRKDWEAADANIFESSDVKKFVDEWFESVKEKSIIQKSLYAVTFKIDATYTTEVYATSLEEAEKLAAQNFSDADFGEAENIDGDIIAIDDADGNRIER